MESINSLAPGRCWKTELQEWQGREKAAEEELSSREDADPAEGDRGGGGLGPEPPAPGLLECRPRPEEAPDQSPNSLSLPLQKEGVGRPDSSTPVIDPGPSEMRGPAVWNVLCVSLGQGSGHWQRN